MNGPTGNTASGAFEKRDRRLPALNLTTCQKMLPLVRRIVADIVQTRQRLAQLHPEQNHLDRHRQELTWPLRSRRYQLREEVAAAEQHLEAITAELGNLAVVILAAEGPRVGFPTTVNGRRAFFSWQPGEDNLKYWSFAGEATRRLIPATWLQADQLTMTGKG